MPKAALVAKLKRRDAQIAEMLGSTAKLQERAEMLELENQALREQVR